MPFKKETQKGVKGFYIKLPTELHRLAKQVAFAHDISVTKLIVHYLEYLKALPCAKRKVLHDGSIQSLTLDGVTTELLE